MREPIRRKAGLPLRLALVVWLAAACTVRSAAPLAPGDYPRARASLTLRDGSRAEIERFSVRRDSIVGLSASGERRRLAFAVDDVAAMEHRQPSDSRSITVLAGTALAVGVIWVVVRGYQVINDPNY